MLENGGLQHYYSRGSAGAQTCGCPEIRGREKGRGACREVMGGYSQRRLFLPPITCFFGLDDTVPRFFDTLVLENGHFGLIIVGRRGDRTRKRRAAALIQRRIGKTVGWGLCEGTGEKDETLEDFRITSIVLAASSSPRARGPGNGAADSQDYYRDRNVKKNKTIFLFRPGQ